MEFANLLEMRRSIRNFKANSTISESQIKEMIDAALQAPTWKNSETGRYYIALSPEKIEYIKNECLPSFNANSSRNAVAIIVTAYETKCAGFENDGTPTNELGDKWGVYGLGLQNENLILKARELGYDTLIMGIRDAAKIKDAFNIPDLEEIVSVISVGIRESDPAKPKRKTPDEIAKFF